MFLGGAFVGLPKHLVESPNQLGLVLRRVAVARIPPMPCDATGKNIQPVHVDFQASIGNIVRPAGLVFLPIIMGDELVAGGFDVNIIKGIIYLSATVSDGPICLN